MKKQNVMEEDWDVLIILDACRYDYFEKVYSDYFDGDLEKRDSEAGATPEWLYKTFTDDYDYFDISYISANPYIGLSGTNLLDINEKLYDWCSSELFSHIVDAWNEDGYWSDKFTTVLPEDLMKAVSDNPTMNRRIIHFMQPHLPFIHPESKFKMNSNVKEAEEKELSIIKRIRNYLFYDVLRKIVKNKNYKWKIRNLFDVPSLNRYEEIKQIGQGDRIEEFYEYSIRRVMSSLKDFVGNVNGRVVITADHGECFGEYGLWGHENENHNPILTSVPWLEVKG